jgi:2-hydroxycyclohexanecarboxyl-CoA dehydrogenase
VVGVPTTLISGGASGIAGATAVRLARRGDRVVFVDANEHRLAEVARAIGVAGGLAETYLLEERDRGGLEGVCADVVGRLGGISYLFSGAGEWREGLVSELALEDWQLVIDTHLVGAFHICQVVLPYMIEHRHGAVVLESSDLAVVGLAAQASRAAAKTALYALTKALALEFAPYGVRVNAIGPGLIEPVSPHADDPAGSHPEMKTAVPMGRLGRPEEVASVTDFLLSDRASFITGQLLQPNGGRIMW